MCDGIAPITYGSLTGNALRTCSSPPEWCCVCAAYGHPSTTHPALRSGRTVCVHSRIACSRELATKPAGPSIGAQRRSQRGQRHIRRCAHPFIGVIVGQPLICNTYARSDTTLFRRHGERVGETGWCAAIRQQQASATTAAMHTVRCDPAAAIDCSPRDATPQCRCYGLRPIHFAAIRRIDPSASGSAASSAMSRHASACDSSLTTKFSFAPACTTWRTS